MLDVVHGLVQCLVRPSSRSQSGYRLYDDGDLERLQTVLFYRELGFKLDEIRALLADPAFDRGEALREQRKLLAAEIHRLERMVRTVDEAIAAHEKGERMSEEAMFEVFGEGHRDLRREAEERWGDTGAWTESRRRTAHYTRRDWEKLKSESQGVMARIVAVFRSSAVPDSGAAMDAVEAHRRQISERFYDCTREMHVHLGELYVQDARFTQTYEALAPGLAVWVRDAIRANAQRSA